MPSDADLLTAWLAEEPDGYSRIAVVHRPIGRKRSSCTVEERSIPDTKNAVNLIEIRTFRGFGPTPAAAIRAALEKARRG